MSHEYVADIANKINELTFGVEIETSGRDTHGVADILTAGFIAAGFPAIVENVGGYQRQHDVKLADGRCWSIVADASIQGIGAEVVSPILKGADDMLLLQHVVRILREAGLKSSAAHGCGIHVHVGVGHVDANTLCRIVATVGKFDGFIRQAAGVSDSRRQWCKPIEPTRAAKLMKATTKQGIANAWYDVGTNDSLAVARSRVHYDSSRYYGLNLHSVFYNNRGTAEFRYFDGTLHAGVVRSYVTLALCLVAKSIVVKQVSAKPFRAENKSQATSALLRLGMMGNAFKNVREHLIKNFPDAVRPAPVAV